MIIILFYICCTYTVPIQYKHIGAFRRLNLLQLHFRIFFKKSHKKKKAKIDYIINNRDFGLEKKTLKGFISSKTEVIIPLHVQKID